MSISKKNLDKLNQYKKNKILNNDTHKISNCIQTNNNENAAKDQLKAKDPKKIFYSLIDNSESLGETSKVNHLLRNSEINQININSNKANHSKKLTTEEELYDEFNYLLDE